MSESNRFYNSEPSLEPVGTESSHTEGLLPFVQADYN